MILATLCAIYANGTTVLPLANISTSFSVYQNDTHLIHFLSDDVVSIYTHDAYYYYHIEGNKQACYKQEPEAFPEFFPDLSAFELVQANFRRGSIYVSAYRRATHKDLSGGAYFSVYDSEEMFYCIPLNDGFCMPVSYETHGRNPVLNSHTDIYVYDYNEVDVMPDGFSFNLPKECEGVTLSKRPDLSRGPEERVAINYKSELPKELDWRVRGFSTPIKDQASCGSCWTFAVTGMLEGRINAVRGLKNPKIRLSEQYFLNCLWTYDKGDMDNQGCNGGFTLIAMQTMLEKYGGKLPLEHASPYIGFESRCEDALWDSEVLVEKTYQLEKTSEALRYALQHGPVAVSIAVPSTMSYYSGGIYDDPECGYGEKAHLTHAVVAVGYGSDAVKGDYWIIKNSWSNKWGVDGFLYLKDDNDLCGVLQRMVVADIRANKEGNNNALIAGVISVIIASGLAISLGFAYYFYYRHRKGQAVEELLNYENENYVQ